MIGPRRTEHMRVKPLHSNIKRVVVALTGASGIVLGIRLIEIFNSMGVEVYSVVTEAALKISRYECISEDFVKQMLKKFSHAVYEDHEIEAPIASSSFAIDAVVLIPCSINSLASIVRGLASRLHTRAALNALRMGRKVVAVVRESPLGVVELEVMYEAAKKGIHIVPAVVGFYTKPQNLKEIVDFIVGKVLDLLGIENELYRRWPYVKEVLIPDPCQYLYEQEDS